MFSEASLQISKPGINRPNENDVPRQLCCSLCSGPSGTPWHESENCNFLTRGGLRRKLVSLEGGCSAGALDWDWPALASAPFGCALFVKQTKRTPSNLRRPTLNSPTAGLPLLLTASESGGGAPCHSAGRGVTPTHLGTEFWRACQ